MPQSSDLQSIVYVSAATRPMTSSDLEALLIEARDLNAANHVSGVLLYGDGDFMQCFEGAPEAVRGTYERIRASRKHSGIVELLNETIRVRRFPAWQMGFAQADAPELLAMSTANWECQVLLDKFRVSESGGMSLLLDFWSRQAHSVRPCAGA